MLMLEYKCGLLTFKGYVKKNNRNEILSVCECGNEYSQPKSKFAKKHCVSCGCYKKDKSKENGKHNSTHGMTKTPIHRIWGSMKQRCYNPKDSHYEFYGEKGIEVFEDRGQALFPKPRHLQKQSIPVSPGNLYPADLSMGQ